MLLVPAAEVIPGLRSGWGALEKIDDLSSVLLVRDVVPLKKFRAGGWLIAERLEERLPRTGTTENNDLYTSHERPPLYTITPSEYLVSHVFESISIRLLCLAASPECVSWN